MQSYKAADIIKCKKFEVHIIDEQTLYVKCFKDMYIEVLDIQEGLDIQRELDMGPDVRRILEFEKFVTVTKEAREYVQNYGYPASKEAYIIPSIAQKILFNLFIKLRKQKHPIRAFNHLDAALEWIKL